ncbi:hypothetical protein PF004_g32186, partial [Phytophthora fragariae]
MREVCAESSEQIIAVLGPRLESLGRLAVNLQLGPAIRGDRHVSSRLKAARSLEDVVVAAASRLEVQGDVTADVASLRAQLHSAQAAQAAAENSSRSEVYRHENTMVFLKHARAEVDQLKKEVKRLRALEVHNTKELESYRAAVDAHTELGDRLENRVKLAEETSDRLAQQIKREQEVFKASVASSTAQSRRLHQLLSRMDATDDSATVRYRRRIEDLEERVKRLVRANKTLRSRVKLEEMDPDVLVLVVE